MRGQGGVVLKEEWGRWISDFAKWDWFFTGTFRDVSEEERARGYTQRGPGFANSAWYKFIGSLVCPLGVGKWFRVFEYQKFRGSGLGVPHIHGLIENVGDLRRDEAWKWWFERYGFARILKYDEKMGAGYYLSKYVTKDLGDIQCGIGLNR